MNRTLLALAALAPAAAAAAQTSIDPAHKFAWQENTGWINWADADGGARGVRVHQTFLSGWIWGENIGWITVGDGSPGGLSYANTSGDDAGVNIAADGRLTGFAWGENIGWINFDTLAALGAAQAARLDRGAGRFRGWAWGENVGWLNLDDASQYVGIAAPTCYANCDGSTTAPSLNVNDFICFQSRFAAADPYADCNRDAALNVNDFICFQASFAAGCP